MLVSGDETFLSKKEYIPIFNGFQGGFPKKRAIWIIAFSSGRRTGSTSLRSNGKSALSAGNGRRTDFR